MIDWIYESYFIKYAFCSNYWIWFHILAGGFIARLLMLWMPNYKDRWLDILVTVLFIVVVWEVIEVIFLEGGLSGVVEIYGNHDVWLLDMFGDVLGAMFCSLLVVSTDWRYRL